MRKLGKREIEFPERGTDDHKTWAPMIRQRTLHHSISVVARTRIEGAWKAYVGPCVFADHNCRSALDEVLARGAAVDEDLARAMFPEFDGVDYAG